MKNVLSKIFFAAGLLAYLYNFFDRVGPFIPRDYSSDVLAILLLGILGHFAFERKAGA